MQARERPDRWFYWGLLTLTLLKVLLDHAGAWAELVHFGDRLL
jgi:hypothetical protein